MQKKTPKDHTFYYWKTNLALNNEEKSALQNAKVPLLYTRFFDVDKIDGKFQPVGVITRDANFATEKRLEIIGIKKLRDDLEVTLYCI